MIPAARLSAAIEILADIATKRRPAAESLKEWGQTHRFAGSGDRAAIAGLVYDTLRRRASAAFVMAARSRAPCCSACSPSCAAWTCPPSTPCWTARASLLPPSRKKNERASPQPILLRRPPWVQGDYPQWLDMDLAGLFGEGRAEGRPRPVPPARLWTCG